MIASPRRSDVPPGSRTTTHQRQGSHPASGWRAQFTSWRRLATKWRAGLMLAVLLVGVGVGVVAGRANAPSEHRAAADAIETRLLPLVLDADGVWNSASGGHPPVAAGLVAMRSQGDASIVTGSSAEWLAAYDSILLRMAGVDVPAAGRAVQRHLIAAVTLSRDAVEVLAFAAQAPAVSVDPFLVEVGRLRQRSEQMVQSARASVFDLRGQRADVGPGSPLNPFGQR